MSASKKRVWEERDGSWDVEEKGLGSGLLCVVEEEERALPLADEL